MRGIRCESGVVDGRVMAGDIDGRYVIPTDNQYWYKDRLSSQTDGVHCKKLNLETGTLHFWIWLD